MKNHSPSPFQGEGRGEGCRPPPKRIPAGTAISTAILFSLLALTACGKRGSPTPPGPADQITYPRIYPTE